MIQVIAKNGEMLPPSNRHGKVRHMLKDGQATIVKKNPFTIQLKYDHTKPQTAKAE